MSGIASSRNLSLGSRPISREIQWDSMSLEILNFLLMFFGFFESLECPEIASFSSRHVFFTGIKAILARFKLPYHACVDALRTRLDVLAEPPSMAINWAWMDSSRGGLHVCVPVAHFFVKCRFGKQESFCQHGVVLVGTLQQAGCRSRELRIAIGQCQPLLGQRCGCLL